MLYHDVLYHVYYFPMSFMVFGLSSSTAQGYQSSPVRALVRNLTEAPFEVCRKGHDRQYRLGTPYTYCMIN